MTARHRRHWEILAALARAFRSSEPKDYAHATDVKAIGRYMDLIAEGGGPPLTNEQVATIHSFIVVAVSEGWIYYSEEMEE